MYIKTTKNDSLNLVLWVKDDGISPFLYFTIGMFKAFTFVYVAIFKSHVSLHSVISLVGKGIAPCSAV